MQLSSKNKIEKSIRLIAALAMVIIILVTFRSVENAIISQQDSQIQQLTEFITYEINRIVDVNSLIESYQSKILEQTSDDILLHFADRDYSDIDTQELDELITQYDLSGLALFKDFGDDIIIEKSTSEVEVGLSTKSWGFWYTAYRQLMDDGIVSIDKGTSKENFWIGPRSKAYEQKGFFIFSYTRIPNQPYLLNLFIDDKKAFSATDTFDTNEVFKKLTKSSDYIDEIAIINVEAWNNRFMHEHRSKLQDFTIEYGNYSSFKSEDTYYLNKALELNSQEYIDKKFDIYGQSKVKRYTKLTDNEVLIFVLNSEKQQLLNMRIGFTIVGGLLAIWLLGYLMIQYNNKKFNTLLNIEKERLEVAESYKQTVQILPSIVLRLTIIDDEFIIKHCEGKALQLIGIDSALSQNQALKDIMPDDYILKIKAELENIKNGQSGRFEYSIANHIFENKVELLISDMDEFSLDVEKHDIIILWNDITEIRKSEDRSKFMAYHDYLTMLPNRRHFQEVTEKAIEGSATSFYLAFIDLDKFKDVNDKDGHDIGDELLIKVAKRLKNSIRSSDFAARMGGDEFAVLFENVNSKSEFEDLVKRLKDHVTKPYHINGNIFNIGLSIGISRYPEDGNDYITLLKKADIALYEVKFSNKGSHKYYNSK